uniref:Uncharacterized protein n=1 Tax=Glossina pallidipes TaxID=7398 RepID=A0A1B0AJB1_GLOPL
MRRSSGLTKITTHKTRQAFDNSKATSDVKTVEVPEKRNTDIDLHCFDNGESDNSMVIAIYYALLLCSPTIVLLWNIEEVHLQFETGPFTELFDDIVFVSDLFKRSSSLCNLCTSCKANSKDRSRSSTDIKLQSLVSELAVKSEHVPDLVSKISASTIAKNQEGLGYAERYLCYNDIVNRHGFKDFDY